VFVKLHADSQEELFSLFRHGITTEPLTEMPPSAIKPPGLDTAR